MSYSNPYRYIGDYLAVPVDEFIDIIRTTTQAIEKADFYSAHVVLLANHLTIPIVSAILVQAESCGQRARFSYAISDDVEYLAFIQNEAILTI